VAERDKPAGEAEDEPFLKRWSRLKTDDTVGETAPDALEVAGEALPVEADPKDGAPEETGEASIDPEDLPDIESLDSESDYTVFMQQGVPDELRKLALRKLFLSNPAFAVLDGLNDYDEDYSLLGIAVEKVKTAYVAGRGFLEDKDLVQIDDPDEELAEDEGIEDAPAVADADGAEKDEDVAELKPLEVAQGEPVPELPAEDAPLAVRPGKSDGPDKA